MMHVTKTETLRVINYENGQIYKGNVNLRNERDGYGIQYLPNGGSYKGYWKDDEYLGDKVENPITKLKYYGISHNDYKNKHNINNNEFILPILTFVAIGISVGIGILYRRNN